MGTQYINSDTICINDKQCGHYHIQQQDSNKRPKTKATRYQGKPSVKHHGRIDSPNQQENPFDQLVQFVEQQQQMQQSMQLMNGAFQLINNFINGMSQALASLMGLQLLHDFLFGSEDAEAESDCEKSTSGCHDRQGN